MRNVVGREGIPIDRATLDYSRTLDRGGQTYARASAFRRVKAAS